MRNRTRCFCVILTAALAAGGAAAGASNVLTPDILPYATGDSAFAFAQPDDSPDPAVIPTPTPIPAEIPWTYAISREILADQDDVIRLVNKESLLEKEYPPEDDTHALVDAAVRKTSSSAIKARVVASDALDAMFAAAEADGLKLYLHSGYRAYKTQATMYENRIKNIGRDDGVVQKPGASDHQTGLGFDVISWAWRDSKLNAKFAKTEEAKWMAEHCPNYGFIIRYPEGKEDITGIIFEPWHLRYVGVDVARYMTECALTLEEFTIEWKSAMAEHNALTSLGDGQGQQGAEKDSFSF